MGPVGLGHLLQGNYIADARTFFCPTSGDNMPADAPWYPVDTPAPMIHTKGELKGAGGFDADSVSHGDWVGHPQWTNGGLPGLAFLAVQSNYNYRGVPLGAVALDEDYTANAATVEANGCRIRYTKPFRSVVPGRPVFKTQKQLAGRALIADSFSQPDAFDDVASTLLPPIAGKGVYSHRDGYNVLYGDWSANWHGDPRHEIMYWESVYLSGADAAQRKYPPYLGSPQLNCVYSWTYLDGTGGFGVDVRDSVYLWHLLDVAHGIDVDAN